MNAHQRRIERRSLIRMARLMPYTQAVIEASNAAWEISKETGAFRQTMGRVLRAHATKDNAKEAVANMREMAKKTPRIRIFQTINERYIEAEANRLGFVYWKADGRPIKYSQLLSYICD